MKKVRIYNKISEKGLERFPENKYLLAQDLADPDAILLRSYELHDLEFNESLLAISRAGVGVNNIPIERCSEAGIAVFNTPGANANAVKELVIAALLLSSRKIVEGINWCNSLHGQKNISSIVEKGKKQFVGPELKSKKMGVIGLGAIGVLVANACIGLEMDVMGYDPYMSVDSAWGLSRSVERANSIKEIIEQCDYISLHMPLNKNTKYMFNRKILLSIKPSTRLINFSRDELVEHEGLNEALEKGILAKYICDFPNDEIIAMKNVICTPHIGASTPESEENCALMASMQIRDYLEFGDINNSVNLPNCSLPYTGKQRILVINKNIPNVLNHLTQYIAELGANIDNMINKSKEQYACTIIDLDEALGEREILDKLSTIEGIVRLRVI